MFTLTGLSDEISPDLEIQLDTLASADIHYLELRGVAGKNVLEFDDEDVRFIRERLTRDGFRVSAIASPIGKIKITDDFDKHLSDFCRIVDLALCFRVRHIRIFSYYIPEEKSPESVRNEVIRRIKEKVKIAEEKGLILLHENERGIYGNVPERCRDILEEVDSPSLRALFDPANFVCEQIRPFRDAYPPLENFIEYVHIKDAKFNPEGKMLCTPAGMGDGEIPELLAALSRKGYQGFLSLEPHLHLAKEFSGYSGPDKFMEAVQALKKIITRVQL